MEDPTPDFQDLLAAFDIPDMRVKISEVRSLAPVASSASSPTTKAVESGSSTTVAMVKQEPDPTVNDTQITWQQTSEAESVVKEKEGMQTTSFGTENESDNMLTVKSLLNGSVTNGDAARSFFQPSQETPFSAQHAKVVSSTLMANSWATAKSAGTKAVVTIAPKPSRADKTSTAPIPVPKYTRPTSSGSSTCPPKVVATPVTASMRVSFVSNSNKQPIVVPVSSGSVPPLIVGSSAPRPTNGKLPSIVVNVSGNIYGNKNTKYKAVLQPVSVAKAATENKSLPLSSSDLLRRVNPIPRHQPKVTYDVKDAKYVKRRYPCEECGDIFLVDSSLKMHKERRSVQISFSCNFCVNRRRLMFYNKCSFFAHLRQHSQQMKLKINAASQASYATVSPLTYNKPLQHSNVIIYPDINADAPQQQTSSANGEKETATTEEGPGLKFTNVFKPWRKGAYPCRMCETRCKSEHDLRAHMQRYVQNTEVTCPTCKMTLLNKCQLKAHTIMHRGVDEIWVCPECCICFIDFKSFTFHLAKVCLHWHRQLRTVCKLCTRMVSNYEQHLDKGHEMLFYRCVSCSMAFKTLPALKEHSEQKHKVQPGSPLCRIISKCPFCETVFMQKPLLLAHIKMHIDQDKDRTKTWALSCPECTAVANDLLKFKKHLNKAHPTMKHLHCDFCHQSFAEYEHLWQHLKGGTATEPHHGQSDSVCMASKSPRFQNNQNLLRKKEDSPVRDKGNTNTKFPETSSSPTTSSDDKTKEQPLKKIYVKKTRSCPGCRKNGKTLYFFREEDLRYHMSKSHPEMKLSSINSEDCVKYVTIKPKEDSPKLNPNLDEKSDPATEGTSRKRKSIPETADDKPSRKVAKVDLPTEFTCAKAKCGFNSRDRNEFKTHIAAHRPDPSLPQCEECGTCFRVESALRRHLFIQHSIKEYDAYIRQLRGGNPSPTPDKNSVNPHPVQETTPDESPSSSATVAERSIPLECQVCYKIFQNEGNLRTHMRNHGMAFIRSKRSTSND